MHDLSREALWERIRDISQRIQASSSRHLLPPSSAPVNLVIPTLNIPIPVEFSSSLRRELPFRHFSRVSARLQEAAIKLQTAHRESYSNACQKYLESTPQPQPEHHLPLDAIRSKYETEFYKQLASLEERVLASCRGIQEAHPEPKRATFNREYTPLFEKYFEYNAFPSARDREWLARKSMMTPRQIEVWFQNHRRRARKDGKQLQKLSDNLPLELSLESLQETMAAFIVPRKKRPPKPSRLPPPPPEPIPVATTSNILDSFTSPSFAFPTKFVLNASLLGKIFPCRTGNMSFPAPAWIVRTPPRHRKAQEYCSIHDLCDAFNLLRIAGPPTQPSRTPWYAFRCTGPIPAPHPSLIRIDAELPRAAPSQLPSSRPPALGPIRRKRRSHSSSPLASRHESTASSPMRVLSNLSSCSSGCQLDVLESSLLSCADSLRSEDGVDDLQSQSPFRQIRLLPPRPNVNTAFDAYALAPRSFSEAQWWTVPPRPSSCRHHRVHYYDG